MGTRRQKYNNTYLIIIMKSLVIFVVIIAIAVAKAHPGVHRSGGYSHSSSTHGSPHSSSSHSSSYGSPHSSSSHSSSHGSTHSNFSKFLRQIGDKPSNIERIESIKQGYLLLTT